MSLMRAARDHLVLALMLWLAFGAQALNAADAHETARRLADEADDRAMSLPGRQDALRKLEEAAQLFLGAGEKEEAARALNRAGRLQLQLSAPGDALNSHRQAL